MEVSRGLLTLLFICFYVAASEANFIKDWMQKIHLPGSATGEKRSDSDNRPHVVFRLYTRDTIDNPEEVDSRDLQLFKHLHRGKPIKVTIHGWKGHGNDTFARTMRAAYLPKMDVNLIQVDWSGHGSRGKYYPYVRKQVPSVGATVADFLNYLNDNGQGTLGTMHLIGHSLGAHIAGIAGKATKVKVGRVTGLDPAGPQFSRDDVDGRLCPESAKFVDVIHTTANFLGYGDPIGHIDFYPNGGKAVQPGCKMDITGACSHRRSFQLYADSVINPLSFPSVPCESYVEFELRQCDYQHVVFMGETVEKSKRGKYFMQTNDVPPYSRDYSGIIYAP